MSASPRILSRFSLLLAVVFLAFATISFAGSQEEPVPAFDEHETPDQKEFDAAAVILHHVVDDHIWHLWEGHSGTIFLPVIVYSSERGLETFSSHHFYNDHHQIIPYNGYTLEHNHIMLNGKAVLDLSITKNVAMLLITAVVMFIILMAAANGYKKNRGKAPSGIQSFIEPIIIFLRDEVVKPNLGAKTDKYFPYLLTLFFFILIGNILGLLPGAGNLTGNIAVTVTLAFLTFLITNFSGNKQYWSHILWTPGVPLPLRIVILPVEIIGIFTKPFSLTVRLFVAITAGHIVLLSLICLTFVFKSYTVGVVSSVIVLFINLIEILVAGIQAYVFTQFTALYIGMAVAEHDHDDHH